MKENNILYENFYQSILTQLYSGVYRHGQTMPSLPQICQQYNIGITTARKVYRMLEKDGFIRTTPRKRAVVSFDASNDTYISMLLQRRQSIQDLYQGLLFIMPPFYAESTTQHFNNTKLQQILNRMTDKLEHTQLILLASHYFAEILTSFQNQLLLDLHADIVHFVQIPKILNSKQLNSYFVTVSDVKMCLSSMQEMLENNKQTELFAFMELLYQKTETRITAYLSALENLYQKDNKNKIETSCQWFSGKKRAPLYAIIAHDLHKRIYLGEFKDAIYLPSIPDLMQTYNISKETACNAIALLSDLGFVLPIDKKGIVLRDGASRTSIRLAKKTIDENLILFLDVLQILAVCAKRLVYATVTAMEEEDIITITKTWEQYPAALSPAYISHILLDFLKCYIPYQCLKNILRQFDDLLIWGYYFERLEKDATQCNALRLEIQQHFSTMITTLRCRDYENFSSLFQSIFKASYHSSRNQLLIDIKYPELLPSALS